MFGLRPDGRGDAETRRRGDGGKGTFMRTVYEPARETPVIAEVDVCVVGGGPGGLPAAVAAARCGARTLLVERYGFLGGLATAGLVSPILAHTASRSDRPIVEGLLKEMVERMCSLGGAPRWKDTLSESGVRFEPEALKRVADLMVQEAGVELLLHAWAADVMASEGRIDAVLLESKSGRGAVAAKVFVDATGDADVAFRAGVPTRQGRAFDGAVESMGSFVHIGGAGRATAEQRRGASEQVKEEMLKGRLPFYNPGIASSNLAHRDRFSPNVTRWAGDPTDVRDLTKAELDIRRDVWEMISVVRERAPGFEDAYLQATSPQVGPRESRQVLGAYELTGDDVHRGAKFGDAVARGSWWIDIHCPLGEAYPVHLCVRECPRGEECPFWAAEHERMFGRDELHPPDDDWYDIPYRCLVPRESENLLASGRCISATHEGMAGARVMATCMAIGQAAGTAAAMAVDAGVAPRDVDVQALRARLSADGALV